MAKEFTLDSSRTLGDEFSDKAAEIFKGMQDGDTLYLADVSTDAAFANQIAGTLGLNVKILPAPPAGPVW